MRVVPAVASPTSWLVAIGAATVVVGAGVLAFPFGVELSGLIFFIVYRAATETLRAHGVALLIGTSIGAASVVGWTVVMFIQVEENAVRLIAEQSLFSSVYEMASFLESKIQEPYVVIYPLLINISTLCLIYLFWQSLKENPHTMGVNIPVKNPVGTRMLIIGAFFLLAFAKFTHVVNPVIDLLEEGENHFISPVADSYRGHFLIAWTLPAISIGCSYIVNIILTVILNPRLIFSKGRTT